MAETPTIFAQAAGDPVKVVAATEGVNPKTSPYDIVVPTGSPIKTVAQLRGHTVAVQEGTVEQYFLVQALAHAQVPVQRRPPRQPGGDDGLDRGDQRPGRRGRDQPSP